MVENISQKLYANLCLTLTFFFLCGLLLMYFEHQSVRYQAEYLLIFDKKNKQRHRTFRDFLIVNEEACPKKIINIQGTYL